MQGLFLNGRRPKSKVEVKRHLATQGDDGYDRYALRVEATSMFGNEASGTLHDVEAAGVNRVYFVGPDPYTSRKFYGQLNFKNDIWSVK